MDYWRERALIDTDFDDQKKRRVIELQGGEKDWWEAALSRVLRYEGLPMIHRSNDLLHVQRVSALAQYLGEKLEAADAKVYKTDPELLLYFGLHHDDVETLTGDYPATEKARMSREERESLAKEEFDSARACGLIYFRWNSEAFNGYVFSQKEIREKQTLASQIVDVADKWDALGEIINESANGHQDFIELLAFRRRKFAELQEKYSWLHQEHQGSLSWLTVPTDEEVAAMIPLSKEKILTSSDPRATVLGQSMPLVQKIWLEQVFDHCPDPLARIFPGWFDARR